MGKQAVKNSRKRGSDGRFTARKAPPTNVLRNVLKPKMGVQDQISFFPQEVQDEIMQNQAYANGLEDVLGGDGDLNFMQQMSSGLGPTRQPLSAANTIFDNLRWYFVSNFRQMLSEAYVEISLIQTIVDVPVDDGLRGGIEIQTKQLSPKEVDELLSVMDREDDINTVAQACKWNRLFGGAGIILLTDQDPSTPLDVDALRRPDPFELRAVDMWELFWDKQNTEGYDPEVQSTRFDFYNYYAEKLHASRVMRLKGLTAPSFLRPRLRGWGFSIVETLIRSINQYLKANDLTFEVLDEFKLDIFKIKNLTNSLMSPAGEQQIRKRIGIANREKNYNNAITMDAEDDYVQKQLSFSGLGEVMAGLRMQIASDMRIPMTKLFGISAAGFNSGEDDIEVYNAMVESQVRSKVKWDLARIVELRCQWLFGHVPDDLKITFKPLRVLSAEQEENVKTQQHTRVITTFEKGLMSAKAAAEAINKGSLLPIQIDINEATLLVEAQQDLEAQAQADAIGDESDNEPGADKEDGQKAQQPKDKKTAPSGHPPSNRAPATGKANQPKPPRPASAQDRVANSAEFLSDYMSLPYEIGEWFELGPNGQKEYQQLFNEKCLSNPGKVDEAKWQKAKEASKHAFKEDRWPFITWWYQQHGGSFN